MSDVQIEICSEKVDSRSFEAKDGRRFNFREQRGYFHVSGDPYPMPCKIALGDRAPWPVGRYRLGSGSYVVGRYGSLELARELELVPLPAEAARPAAARAAG